MSYANRLAHIEGRKARLIAQCARQRDQFAAELNAWRGPVSVIDRGMQAGRLLKAHPVIAAVLLIAVAVIGRRHLLRWAGRGLIVWKFWNTVRSALPARGAWRREA